MNRPSRRVVLASLAAAIALPPSAQAARSRRRPARPVDEAKRDAALVKVRDEVLAAVKARDVKAVLAHCSPDVKLGFDGSYGLAEFEKGLNAEPVVWEEMVWILEHGGQFQEKNLFAAPYTFTIDIGDLDPFDAGFVVAPKVQARAAPRAEARVVATLGHEIVSVVDWKRTDTTPAPFYKREDWLQIKLRAGGTAWVPADVVRSNVDYRIGFERTGKTWKISFFLAGD
jgi:hypothetical protein